MRVELSMRDIYKYRFKVNRSIMVNMVLFLLLILLLLLILKEALVFNRFHLGFNL